MRGLTYVCPHCGHVMRTSLKRPGRPGDQWPVRPLPEHRRLCTECGRFAIPEELAGNKEWAENCWGMFSGCPNACRCAGFGQYNADCERGLVMQKCFLLVHIQLECLEALVRKLAGRIEPGCDPTA